MSGSYRSNHYQCNTWAYCQCRCRSNHLFWSKCDINRHGSNNIYMDANGDKWCSLCTNNRNNHIHRCWDNSWMYWNRSSCGNGESNTNNRSQQRFALCLWHSNCFSNRGKYLFLDAFYLFECGNRGFGNFHSWSNDNLYGDGNFRSGMHEYRSCNSFCYSKCPNQCRS